MIVIAGPNGSGKTSLTQKLLLHQWVDDCIYINPDNIAQEKYGDWNSLDAVMQAAKFSEKLREECLLNRKSFVFETVFSSNEKVEFVKKVKEAGYFIRFFFVSTSSPIINSSRIARRVIGGGHDVPISKIISRYSKAINNCAIISTIVDRAYIYDNSVDFEDPKLIFRISKGNIIKVYNQIPNWALNIYKSEISE